MYSLSWCCHHSISQISQISQSLRLSRMLKESAMPTSRPQRSQLTQLTHGWCLCRNSSITPLEISTISTCIRNSSQSYVTLWLKYVDMFLSWQTSVAAKCYVLGVLKAWYAYLSDRRQRLRSFLEGAAQSLLPLQTMRILLCPGHPSKAEFQDAPCLDLFLICVSKIGRSSLATKYQWNPVDITGLCTEVLPGSALLLASALVGIELLGEIIRLLVESRWVLFFIRFLRFKMQHLSFIQIVPYLPDDLQQIFHHVLLGHVGSMEVRRVRGGRKIRKHVRNDLKCVWNVFLNDV